ncbi:MAG: hypothetical protein ACRD02_15220 [Acidimicrobiia bacterium]
MNTLQYAQGFRSTEEALGLAVGPTQTVRVGEATTGLAWEARLALKLMLNTWSWREAS